MTDRFAFERARVAALNEEQSNIRTEIWADLNRITIDLACVVIGSISVFHRSIKLFGKCKELVKLWANS